MTALHVLNGLAWLTNGIVWMFVAHVPAMAITSMMVAVAQFWVARKYA